MTLGLFVSSFRCTSLRMCLSSRPPPFVVRIKAEPVQVRTEVLGLIAYGATKVGVAYPSVGAHTLNRPRVVRIRDACF